MKRIAMLLAVAGVAAGCSGPVAHVAGNQRSDATSNGIDGPVKSVRTWEATVTDSGPSAWRMASATDYDRAGLVVGKVEYVAGRPVAVGRWSFDRLGRPSLYTEFSDKYDFFSKTSIFNEYDSSGRASAGIDTRYSTDPPRSDLSLHIDLSQRVTRYDRDAQGRLASGSSYSRGVIGEHPSRSWGVTTSIFGPDGRLASSTMESGMLASRTDYVRDRTGRVIEEHFRTAFNGGSLDRHPGRVDRYEYDQNGDVTLHVTESGSDTTTVTYSGYRLDNQGNLVYRIVTEQYDPPGCMSEQLATRPPGTYAERREIAYY